MRQEYEPAFGDAPTVLACTATDANITIPKANNPNPLSNKGRTGSLWWIMVDGNPVSLNYGAPAVFATNPILEVSTGQPFAGTPIFIEPGTVVHGICASTKTATVSFVRAYRKS